MPKYVRILFLIWLGLATLSLANVTKAGERRVQLIHEIASLNQLGLSVEKQSDTPASSRYLLHIIHPETILRSLTGGWAYAAPALFIPTEILEAARGARVAVDVDWHRYLTHRPESVQVAWFGRDANSTSPSVSKFLEDRGLSLLLTFGSDDRLKQARLKPIDAHFREGNATTHLHVQDWLLTLRRFTPDNRYDTALHLRGGTFRLEQQTGTGAKSQIGFAKFECDLDARHSYDGTLQCVLPTLSFVQGEDRIIVDQIRLMQQATVKGHKVASDVTLGADTLRLEHRSPQVEQMLRVDTPRFKVWAKDINATLLQKLETLMLRPRPDRNATQQQGRKLMGQLASSRTNSGYALSVDRIAGRAEDPKTRTMYEARALSTRVVVTLGKTLAYQDRSSAGAMHMEIHNKGAASLKVNVDGVNYALAMDHLYNPFPALIALPERLRTETNSSKDERWYFEEVVGHVIHTGAQAAIAPLRIGGVTLISGKQKEAYAPTELRLKARLKPNTIDVRRSTAPMMMLGYLDLSGRWVLKKRDFQQLLTHVSTQIRIMATIFVRYEGDKAIFDLAFDHGHLRINGKQIL